MTMDECQAIHEVRDASDLTATFETLIAAFGYDAVATAWLEASGDAAI